MICFAFERCGSGCRRSCCGSRFSRLARLAVRQPPTRGSAWLPALWLAPPTLVGFQYGNFQTGIIAISVIAMVAFTWRRDVSGSVLLAFVTLGKLFPGVLVAALVARRRWRALALTAASALVLVMLALLMFGRKPFDDFASYQIPAIASGAAFSFNDRPHGGFLPITASMGSSRRYGCSESPP